MNRALGRALMINNPDLVVIAYNPGHFTISNLHGKLIDRQWLLSGSTLTVIEKQQNRYTNDKKYVYKGRSISRRIH